MCVEESELAAASVAITRLSIRMEILRSTVFGIARAMRESEHGRNSDPLTALWPEGEKGRGREAHVLPRHVVSLGIGIALPPPITELPKLIPVYRDLVPWSTRREEVDFRPLLDRSPSPATTQRIDPGIQQNTQQTAWLPGNTLAEGLEQFADQGHSVLITGFQERAADRS